MLPGNDDSPSVGKTNGLPTPRLEIGDNFATVAATQPLKGGAVDIRRDETNGAVGHQDMNAACVKAASRNILVIRRTRRARNETCHREALRPRKRIVHSVADRRHGRIECGHQHTTANGSPIVSVNVADTAREDDFAPHHGIGSSVGDVTHLRTRQRPEHAVARHHCGTGLRSHGRGSGAAEQIVAIEPGDKGRRRIGLQ